MFPENYAVLVVGDPAAGMLEFCCYLGSSYLRAGERMVMVEADTYPGKVKSELKRFGVDVQTHEREKSLIVLDCYSSSFNPRMPKDKSSTCDITNLKSLVELVSDSIEVVGGPPVRVLFNSLTPLFIHHEPPDIRDFFSSLSETVKLSGALTCTAHRGILEDEQIDALSSVADGVLEIRTDESFRRFVRIKFMRGLQIAPKWVPFDFEERDSTEGAFLSWNRD